MREIGLEERKKLQLDILLDVASFCEKHGIIYFLSSGTLLGAVRHQGYIPWDDDIDIMMPRPDYERFFALYNSSKYYAVDSFRDNEFPYHMAKIIDTRTFLKEKRRSYHKLGVHIDLFPLDGVNIEHWKSHLHIVEFYEYIRNAKCTCVSDFSNVWKRICYRLLQAFLSVYSKRWLACKIRECLMKYSWETSEYVSSLASWSEKYPILKSNFDKGVSVWFEGKQYNAPMGYDNWLKLIYGNYMQLPPEEKRILGHAVTAFYK